MTGGSQEGGVTHPYDTGFSWSVVMIEVREIGFKKFGTELRRGWPPADFSWQCYYMLGNTNELSVLFQLSSGVVVTPERNILLRLRCNCN